MPSKKFYITGASGFIGSYLIEELKKKDCLILRFQEVKIISEIYLL